MVAGPIAAQGHHLARASILLTDNGMGHEGIVLNRVMLEHTIVLTS
jgi:hypothetical protein